MHVIAIDWSGRSGPGQAQAIWAAEAHDGRLVDLRNGRSRAQVAPYLAGKAAAHGELVAGLDFSFSLPAWWVREQGFASAREVWRWAERDGEAVIATHPHPFWGAKGSTAPAAELRLRRTEEALRAKSTFQLAGSGAVGVGSVRGMPVLLELAEAHGFGVWPFDPPGRARVVEIYPRALTGPVVKTRWEARRAYLHERFAGQDPVLLERAAGSEDAFDAAVSALVMSAHAEALAALGPAEDETERLEGRIWRP